MIPNSIAEPMEGGFAGGCLEPFKNGTRNELWLIVREGRRFILKGLPESLRSHPEEVARLRKEYSLGLRINHHGVAGVYGFETHPIVGPVIVMEYVDGITLADFLKEYNEIPLKVRIEIARQMADALAYIHSLGVSHRDLKPDNILITHRNDAKIIDIGLGDSEDSAIFKQSRGTEDFGAPEQQLPGSADSRADVYSFGKILEMLFPEKKFGKLIARCLQDNPGKRISMREAEGILAEAMKPRKRGLWVWILIFYGIMLGIGLIFGIIDEVILKNEGNNMEMQETGNAEIMPKENVREPENYQEEVEHEAILGLKPKSRMEIIEREVKKPDEKPTGDNANYVAIYDKYMVEMNDVLARDYKEGMDKDAAMSLMSSKSIEVANILSRMVDELSVAGCPYDEMSRLSNLMYENVKKAIDQIYGDQ